MVFVCGAQAEFRADADAHNRLGKWIYFSCVFFLVFLFIQQFGFLFESLGFVCVGGGTFWSAWIRHVESVGEKNAGNRSFGNAR